jgi:hypothetical protein
VRAAHPLGTASPPGPLVAGESCRSRTSAR